MPVGATKRRQKRSKNFFSFNLAKWRREELHALADCYGVPLRTLFWWSLMDAQERVERATGLTARQALAMTKEKRINRAELWQQFDHRVSIGRLLVPTN